MVQAHLREAGTKGKQSRQLSRMPLMERAQYMNKEKKILSIAKLMMCLRGWYTYMGVKRTNIIAWSSEPNVQVTRLFGLSAYSCKMVMPGPQHCL